MTVTKVTAKYTYWKDGADYVLTGRKNREIMRGTLSECEAFETAHPYGVTALEIEALHGKG